MLKIWFAIPGVPALERWLHNVRHPKLAREVFGIRFENPVGLAAGFDKDAEAPDAMLAAGFGFTEMGSVTPKPQAGNPQPRLFRLPQANAIINRLGFNNHGVDQLIENVKRSDYQGILGINIGKNFDTPIENAADDYLIGLRKVYRYASYVTINISSPNTKNLRQLQDAEALDCLLSALKCEQEKLTEQHGKYKPLAVKIAPDLESEQIIEIAALLIKHKIDGVIATNTTLSRVGVEEQPESQEAGGLSGAPLTQKSTAVIRQLHAALQDVVPIIGVGGIISATDAQEKLSAGASLVQIYTGMIYRGPDLVKEIVQAVCAKKS